MKKYFLLGCLFLCCFAAYGQTENRVADSIKQQLKRNIPDTVRIACYKKMANVYAPTDSTVSFGYMQQAVDLPQKKGMHREAALALNDLGYLFEQYGNTERAIYNYYASARYALAHNNPKTASVAYNNLFFIYKGLDYARSLLILDTALAYANQAGYKKLQANLHNNLGNELVFVGRYEESMTHLLTALKMYEALGDSINIVATYSNIGNNYNHLKQYDNAIRYMLTGLKIAGDKTTDAVANLLINISSSYYYKHDYKTSIAYTESVVRINELHPLNQNSYAGAIGNLGICYKDLGDYAKAERYLKEELELRNKLKDKYNYCAGLLAIGEVYAITKKYDKAKAAFLEVRQLGEELKMPNIVLASMQSLAEFYYRTGHGAEAYALLDKAFNLRDSLHNGEMVSRINELETKYRTAQKESQIAVLNEKNKIQQLTLSRQQLWIFTIASICVLAIISVYLLQRARQLRKEAAHQLLLKAQQERATQSMIEAELNERRRIATELHDGIGQTFSAVRMNLSGINEHVHFNEDKHRSIYNKSIGMIDEGCQELRTISHMMMPELLLKKGFEAAMHELVNRIDQQHVSINLAIHNFPSRLSQHQEMTLYRVSQEIVQNALKHAQANTIDIQISYEQSKIFLTTEDDGVGFDITKINHTSGMGLNNLRSRVALLKGTVEIDSRPGAGTVVTVTLPISNNEQPA